MTLSSAARQPRPERGYTLEPLQGLDLHRRRDPAAGGRAAQPEQRRGRDDLSEPARGDGTGSEALSKRLHRIEGQVRGIEKMVVEGRPCIDILTQVGAVTTALESLGFILLEEHVHHCIAGALDSGEADRACAKTEELLAAVQRFSCVH